MRKWQLENRQLLNKIVTKCPKYNRENRKILNDKATTLVQKNSNFDFIKKKQQLSRKSS